MPSGRSAIASAPWIGPLFFERDGHGAFPVRHRPAVRPIKAPRAAPFALADGWAASPECSRCLVVEGNSPSGVGGIDGGGQRLQQFVGLHPAVAQCPVNAPCGRQRIHNICRTRRPWSLDDNSHGNILTLGCTGRSKELTQAAPQRKARGSLPLSLGLRSALLTRACRSCSAAFEAPRFFARSEERKSPFRERVANLFKK